MGKNREVKVKFSTEELEKVRAKAKELGIPISTFLRFLGLKADITIANIQ